jgi:ABC-type nickel/cobalt efflux system permease component RcnA
MLSNPLDQRVIEFEALPLGAESVISNEVSAVTANETSLDRNDPFTRLIQTDRFTFATILAALGIAFFWGGMHAMTPGHGKTIVGAYLVGSRGTPLHAVYLGVATTVTHTAGVIALGGLTLLASRFFLPEKLFPWLNLLSGLLVVGIGMSLFFSRLKHTRHISTTAHDPVQEHDHEGSHTHDHENTHHHDHEHEAGHTHHDHIPPGGGAGPVTWRSLLALGISGGLLPCPSALVVMLGAIALDRIGFGLVLVIAFSLGLASVLTVIGLAFLYAGRLFERLPVQKRAFRLLPVVSALFITIVGLGIAVRALSTL